MEKYCKIIVVILIFLIILIPSLSGINIVKNIKIDEGIWEKIEYGEYPGQEPYGLGIYYLSANCSIGSEASYITKDINLDGLTIATIGFSYYFGGHGTAIVNVYSGGYGMNFWEEAIFLFTSSNSPQIDNFESTINPALYSYPDKVYLEFYYFNDYGQSPPGFSIDDISITEIGYFNSFEVHNGSLSGYVTDPLFNAIAGALVRVNFHGTYEQAYSNESGYYHVTNIPICWCMKNCTASKEGYTSEEVWLSINENTTYDFVLSCISLQVDANGPYFGWDLAPIQFHGSVYCGSEPYQWHWDFGDNHSSEEQNPIHKYTNTGEYTVVLTVIDNASNAAKDTTIAIMLCHPYSPVIYGPNHGKPGISYEYSFLLIHPDGDDISYYIDWNDGIITDWTPYIPCGEAYREHHTWDLEDTYTIRAKAKVIDGCESAWTEFEIKISNPRTRIWCCFFDMIPILEIILKYIL